MIPPSMFQQKTPRLVNRAGSNAEMSTHVAFPLAMSSAIAMPVAGPFRMPQHECPVRHREQNWWAWPYTEGLHTGQAIHLHSERLCDLMCCDEPASRAAPAYTSV